MPGLLTRRVDSGSVSANSGSGIWSKHRDSITFDQLQKFWSELSIPKRQGLLKLDKQTLLEQARKNLYCSRCNGLLLEGFSQIVMYGKSLHQGGAALQLSDTMQTSNFQDGDELDEAQNPSVHPWGGLTTTKDGLLTVLDCFICARSLKLLQNVFDSARSREHERELLYPDACGGGVRGWTSQGMISYGRGHGTRETCALHTATLSCDTLVDFWSALSEETRLSLLRMKEEDFIERLIYRFDNKRFCRDCRKNVIREFKELKELKRMKREPRCTSWFCAADSSFSYEVLEDSVQADWHHSFTETIGIYRYFEWAIGTGEGKADILDFQDIGMNRRAQVNGLDLGGLSACFITLRAWRLDGRCTELCVKAHALKGKQCIHRRLIVRDGFVTITWGDNIRRFFEHAEEAEEEDDDAMDKDGNELDGDGPRPQKHAKSPELAREFLLDAATVIFKEQVEKAFREGTARQNAHSIFVCLALKLLEESLHVACKEIITLEKQIKLLEEEEKEKHDEEKRKERRRTKEREKKLRRKERLKGKGRDQEIELMESQFPSDNLSLSSNELPGSTHDESASTPVSEDIIIEQHDDSMLLDPDSPDITEEPPSSQADTFQQQSNAGENSTSLYLDDSFTADFARPRENSRVEKDGIPDWSDKHHSCLSNENGYQHEIDADSHALASSRGVSGLHRPSRDKFIKNNGRACNMQQNDNSHGSNIRTRDRYDPQSCGCNQQSYYRAKDEYLMLKSRPGKGTRVANRTELSAQMPRQIYRVVKHRNGSYLSDSCDILKGRHIRSTTGKETIHNKQVWEPLDSQKKSSESNSEPNDNHLGTIYPSKEIIYENSESHCQESHKILESVDSQCSSEHSDKFNRFDSFNNSLVCDDKHDENKLGTTTKSDNRDVVAKKTESGSYSIIGQNEEVDCHIVINNCDPSMSSYSSDNCSSCLSKGDSSTSSSSAQNAESSSTSDSEDVIQQLDCLDTPMQCNRSCNNLLEESLYDNCKTNGSHYCATAEELSVNSCIEAKLSREISRKDIQESHEGGFHTDLQHKQMLNPQNYGMHIPIFPPQTTSYYNPSGASWLAAPCNGNLPFPQVNNYVFSSRPLGYSYPPNLQSDFSMHYTPVQPLNAPDFDASRHALFQRANSINFASSKDICKNTRSVGSQRIYNAAEPIVNPRIPQRSVLNGQLSSNSASTVKCDIKNGAKPHDESSSFSLFHYGGPMAVLAASYGSNSSSPQESAGSFASKLPTNTCSKEETKIEEYSLFSARNGTRFSFF